MNFFARILPVALLPFAPLARGEWTLAGKSEKAELPGGARFIEREAANGPTTVKISGVFFSEKQGMFAVVDNAGGKKLKDAALPTDAIAAVNGGFFHPDNTPLGLEIAGGQKIHSFEKAKLLAGILVVNKGRPRLLRSGEYTASKGDTDALQAGPVLVDEGRSTVGLSTRPAARRTVVATDGRGRWAMLSLSHVTLADAGAILASANVFPDFPIERALNLDGGSSTALWVATGNPAFYLREIGTVRNFLVIRARP